MTGWIVIWVLGVTAVAAAFANHRYHWAAGWWYSWQHAAHVIEQTEREPGPAPEYGSMILDEEIRAVFLPALPELAHEPDWREQTAAELAPEALNADMGIILCAGCAGFQHCDGVEGACDCTCGWTADWADDSGRGERDDLVPCPVCGGNRWRTVVKGQCWQCRDCGYERGHRNDSGPGDLSSLPPGPDPGDGGSRWDHGPELHVQGGSNPPLSPSRLADTGDIMDAHLLAEVQAFMRRQDAETAEYLAGLESACAQARLDLAEALA